jgi:uncharacterized membrane protein
MATPPTVPTPPVAGPGAPGAATAEAAPLGGWSVGLARGYNWWAGGWRLFTRAPLVWIVMVIIFAAIVIVLSLIPIFGQLASMLLSPVFAAGILLGCRDLDQGRALTIRHLFAGFGERLTPLVVVGLLYLAGWLAITLVCVVALLSVVGLSGLLAASNGDPAQTAFALLGTAGIGAILVLLVAAALLIPLLMAYWFAPALIVFRGDEPVAAMRNSFTASMRNIPPFLLYGLLGLVFSIIASMPLFLGWIVLAPTLAASIFVSYEDIFGIPAWSHTP